MEREDIKMENRAEHFENILVDEKITKDESLGLIQFLVSYNGFTEKEIKEIDFRK
jgi:hypothetical protein